MASNEGYRAGPCLRSRLKGGRCYRPNDGNATLTASPTTPDSRKIMPEKLFLGPVSRARLLQGGGYFLCHTAHRILAVTFNHYPNYRLCA